jgi:hypothetical protein
MVDEGGKEEERKEREREQVKEGIKLVILS